MKCPAARIAPGIHRLRVDFAVTPDISRFVYVYLLEGRHIHCIDTGVHGAEELIAAYLRSLGRDVREIGSILLTHAHPDHMGAAHALHALSGATVYAARGEKDWIENIDAQFAQRPIPNFHTLVRHSARVEVCVGDGDSIALEDGLSLDVLETAGHSRESLSFYHAREQILFTGDAIPAAGDIPIFANAAQSLSSLRKLADLKPVRLFLAAWDEARDADQGREIIRAAISRIESMRACVGEILAEFPQAGPEQAVSLACERLGFGALARNPLLRTSLRTILNERKQPPAQRAP